MKIIFGLLLNAMLFCLATADEPHLTKERVTKIGNLILAQQNLAGYVSEFQTAKPSFDQAKKLWRFPQTKPSSSAPDAGRDYFFEIRDTDGFYRIGTISYSGFWPKSCYKFQMSPALRGKIRNMLK